MRILSVFVDESGDFGKYEKHTPYYIVTMVFHDQSMDISEDIERLDIELRNIGYSNIAIHTEPLIRREEIYANVSPNERRAIFTKLFYFVLKTSIMYKTFVFEKREFEDALGLDARMHKEFTHFIRHNLNFFHSFDKTILYYDNGQHELTRILNMVLGTEITSYELRKVLPVNYKLSQVADLICTLALLEKKTENAELTRSEQLIFHTKRELFKEFIKKIKKKEFKSGVS